MVIKLIVSIDFIVIKFNFLFLDVVKFFGNLCEYFWFRVCFDEMVGI